MYSTKLLKPILGLLSGQGHVIMVYLDDILIIGQTIALAEISVAVGKSTFEKLGFVIHLEKSKLVPITTIDYLGFSINSTKMVITLPFEKSTDLIEDCVTLLNEHKPFN